MEPIDYLRIVARRWRIVGACLLVALVGAWLTTPAQTSSTPVATTYKATHTLIQNPASSTPLSLTLARLFVTVGDVPRAAAKKLGYTGDPAVLAAEVTATEDPKDGTLVITTSDSKPAPASRRANVFAEQLKAYLKNSADKQRAGQVRATQAQLDTLTKRADSLKARVSADTSGRADAELQAVNDQLRAVFAEQLQQQATGTPPPPLLTLQAATAIPETTGGAFTAPTDRRTRLLIAGLLGLLLGAAAALVLERLDTRLRTRGAVENAFAFPVVAEVPRIPSRLSGPSLVLVRDQPETAQAEAYRGLRSSLLLLAPSGTESWSQRERAAVILVTSGRPRDGKSTTVANLAASFAETGKSTLVLDCDLRAPDMHRILDVPQGAGITDLLASRNPGDLASLIRPTSVPGVRLVTSGLAAGHPGVLLAAAGDLIDMARDLCDVILIDTSPLLTANDTTDLLPYADTVLLVARYGRTLPENAHRMHELVTRLGVPVHGVCLTGTPSTTLQPMNASYSVDGRRFKDRLHTGRHQVPTTTPSRRGTRDPQDR